MKKLGVFLFALMFAFAFVTAQDNETGSDETETPTNQIDLAYQCLENQIEDKEQSSLSLQEAIFGTLALGSESKLTGAIEDFEGTNCWPESSCQLKDTAQVLLAYDRINKNTEDIESWVISKNKTATELTWYLQVDIENQISASCDLTYDDNTYTISVNEDMTLSGGPGSCLAISSSGYWLQVNNNCVDETFEISCTESFVTNLLYQRTGSSSYFVSPDTHSASSLGTTEETINSKCFSTSGSCNYEGSLWATLALNSLGKDASPYLPYLLALSETNQRYIPSSFLYMFTNGNDQYNELVQAQQQGQYWQAPNTPYNRFYDTSLALLALSGSSATTEVESTKNYLLDVQTPEGCWNNNNLRDTAFVLYSGWPRAVSTGGGAGGGTTETCASQGYACVSGYTACLNAGGNTLNYDCDALNVCCSVSPPMETCAQQGGQICSASQTCSGTTAQTSDGTCCLGTCEVITEVENACESAGGICDSSGSCKSNEEESSDSCDTPSEVCCVQKESAGGSAWGWVILLIILIALVVLAIVYRKKLQLMFYKFKRKKGGPSSPTSSGRRPPFPPARPRAVPMRRPLVRSATRVPARGRPSRADKEFEETLKKLKDMSN